MYFFYYYFIIPRGGCIIFLSIILFSMTGEGKGEWNNLNISNGTKVYCIRQISAGHGWYVIDYRLSTFFFFFFFCSARIPRLSRRTYPLIPYRNRLYSSGPEIVRAGFTLYCTRVPGRVNRRNRKK